MRQESPSPNFEVFSKSRTGSPLASSVFTNNGHGHPRSQNRFLLIPTTGFSSSISTAVCASVRLTFYHSPFAPMLIMPVIHQHHQYLLTCIGSGFSSYLIFKRYEPHNILAHLILLVVAPLCLAIYCYVRWDSNLFTTIGLYSGTLIASVVAYRLSPFHPLASIPGPKIPRISRLWSAKLNSDSYQHLHYHKLLQTHGSFVRIGPNHVITTEASAIPTVMGAGTFRKSDRYLTFVPPRESGAILVVVDPHEHADRRHLWDKGTNSQAVNGYKEIMDRRLQELLPILSKRQGQDLSLSTWLSLFSFDIMGDLAFNGKFNFMEKHSQDETKCLGDLKSFRKSLFIQDILMQLTWLRQYIFRAPTCLVAPALWLRKFAGQALLDRMKDGPKIKDFFYYLLDEDNTKSAKPLSLPVLIREAAFVIPAGYDSTATALCHTFFYLLSHPICLRKLQDEVDQTFGNIEEIYTSDELHKLPYLNAVINETLRLSPALASGSHRYLPKGNTKGAGGVMLGDTWIPEGTFLQIHTYSMHRNPQYFSPEPDTFIPERWLNKGYNTNQAAYIPFSYGPTNCAGKQIALIKLRKTICVLVKAFDLELSPNFNIEKWTKGVTEQFTLGRGELIARIRSRS